MKPINLFCHLRTFSFDWKTPLGYIVAWFFQCTGATSAHLAIVPVSILIVASSWLFVTIADEMTQELAAFNNDVKKPHGHVGMKRQFCEIIQIHSDAKE